MQGGFEANLAETPDSTTIVGGITMHEALWELEAVGLDLDGDWRPIDHLSYIPYDTNGNVGWEVTGPPDFFGVREKFDEVKDNKSPKDDEYKKRKEQCSLAVQTIYRCYRLKYPVGTVEDETLRKRFDKQGYLLGQLVDQGYRPGDRYYHREYEKYDELRRKLFKDAKPVIPGPQKKNPRTGRLGDYELTEFDQVLPIFETRAELAVDSYSGKLQRREPEVTGLFYDTVDKWENTVSVDEKLKVSFDVIPELGIIRFSEPVYYLKDVKLKDEDGNLQEVERQFPAELRVKIATPLKDEVGQPARFEYFYETPKKYRTTPAKLPGSLPQGVTLPPGVKLLPRGTDTRVVLKNEIVQAFKAIYETRDVFGGQKTTITNIVDNVKTEELEKQALAALDVEYQRIESKDSGSGVYAGLKVLDLDGAIQQIAISRNTTGGMTTTIARNTEVEIYVPTFDERQRNQVLKELIKKQNETVDTTEKVNPKGS